MLYHFENNGKHEFIHLLIEVLDRFILEVKRFSPSTAEGLDEAREFLSQDPIDEEALKNPKKFGKIFGRANHHFSFIRK